MSTTNKRRPTRPAHALAESAQPQRASDRQVGGTHYKDMPVAPWDAMEVWMTPEELRGYHKGVAIGYLARERAKGGNEDIAKAAHHLQRLVELNEGR
jgi:hypothetical protein